MKKRIIQITAVLAAASVAGIALAASIPTSPPVQKGIPQKDLLGYIADNTQRSATGSGVATLPTNQPTHRNIPELQLLGYIADYTQDIAAGAGSANNVTASAVGVDNTVLRWDGATRAVQNSTVTIDDGGRVDVVAAGAASNSALMLDGAIFAAGTTTTNFPHLFIQPSGTVAATTLDAAGTAFGINAPSGLGAAIDIHSNGGASTFKITPAGTVTASGGITCGGVNTGSGAVTANRIVLGKTITAAGTTGARTINTATGSVNFAAGAGSLVVTNSLVDANSVIMVTVASNDASFTSARTTQTTGSFTIFANTAPAAETRVNWVVTN